MAICFKHCTVLTSCPRILDCVFDRTMMAHAVQSKKKKKKKVGHPACSVPNPTRLHMFTMCTQGFHLPIFQHALRLLCIFCSLTQCCNFDVWQVSKALIYSKSYCSQSNFDDFKRTSELKSPRPILHAPLCHYKQSTSDCTSDSVHRL